MENDTIKAALKEAIYQRRSTRAFTGQPVPDDVIEEILDAGRHAPSAMNRQSTRFIVISNGGKLAELRDVMTGVLAGTQEKEGMSAALLSRIRKAREGMVDVTYGAPVLIVTANKKDYANQIADCSCALQNMMLTASAHGLGNCWINQFFTFRDEAPVREFFAALGVAEDEEVCGALAVGCAEDLQTEPLPRTGNPVVYVR